MKELAFGLIRILVVILASIALILPWGLRIKYSALLRWVRDQLMQRSQVIRRWRCINAGAGTAMNEIASTQNLTNRQEEEVAIMFSGGTDSTLAAAIFGMACKAAERVATAREYLEIHFNQQPLPFLEFTPQTLISNL